MKHEKIELSGIDDSIEIDAAKSYIDHRILKGNPLTQRAFNQAMKLALKANEIPMTATELIDFTVARGWSGISISFTINYLNREMEARASVHHGRSTRDIPLSESLHDRSWAQDIVIGLGEKDESS